ncbi:hypothetical protein BV210_12540 [Halorientalis sp. IM1011]|uniref:hypothetical protein n=1 Tax=Halorientalis sp. IM1011 TaxID=1932360 RepID=UPI00097CC59B|nr:hypothetical protein [Halorientalis sp. IM1011]AQL43468.1 hypothetical protein BV210_12540 [Halorientalis sp. IM1011]
MRQPSLFALGASGFVAGTVGTALVLVALTPAPVVAGGIAAALFLAVTAITTPLSTPARVERFQSLRAQIPVVVVPVVLTAAVVTVHYGLLGPGRDVFGPGMVGVGVTFLGAVTMLHAAERRYAARVEAESDVRVVLPDPTADDSMSLIGLVAGGVALLWFFWSVVSGGDIEATMLVVAAGGLAPALSVWHRSELVVLDAGLKQGMSIRPWSDFESYELTDDELIVRDASWFPQAYAIPREKIDDEDAAVAALSRYLPEK